MIYFKKFGLTVLLIAIKSLSLFSQQDNYNREHFGNKSILLSGTVTGSVTDLGLTYYNPARIALVENSIFSINAKAYQYNSLSLKNAVGYNTKLNSSKFNGIPSMFAGTFKIKLLKNHHFAYSFITRSREKFDISYDTEIQSGDILEDIDGVEKYVGKLKLGSKHTDEWFGLTWGKLITKNFSIGVSSYLSIYNFNANSQTTFSVLEESQDVDFYFNSFSISHESYGLFWKVGFAWKLPKIDFGLNIDLPYLEIYKNGKFNYQEALSGISNEDDVFKYADFEEVDSNRKMPLGISIGAGVPIGKSMLHLKIDWHDNLESYDRLAIPSIEDGTEEVKSFYFKSNLQSVINFGAGVEIFISDKYKLFSSFSTDYSAANKNANIFDLIGDKENDVDLNLDFFQVGFGFDIHLKWADLILGTTYSNGTTKFPQKIDFPGATSNANEADDLTKISITRWRGIIGIKIPVFGMNLEVN